MIICYKYHNNYYFFFLFLFLRTFCNTVNDYSHANKGYCCCCFCVDLEEIQMNIKTNLISPRYRFERKYFNKSSNEMFTGHVSWCFGRPELFKALFCEIISRPPRCENVGRATCPLKVSLTLTSHWPPCADKCSSFYTTFYRKTFERTGLYTFLM